MTANIKNDRSITLLIIAYGPNEVMKIGRTSIPNGRTGSTK